MAGGPFVEVSMSEPNGVGWHANADNFERAKPLSQTPERGLLDTATVENARSGRLLFWAVPPPSRRTAMRP